MSKAPEPDELDNIVNQYIDSFIQNKSEAGQSQAEIQNSMDIASFILVIKMLRKAFGKNLPTGNTLVNALAQIMSESPGDTKKILQSFIYAGLMDSSYALTQAGEVLAGQT